MVGLQHGATNEKSQSKRRTTGNNKTSERISAKRKLNASTIEVSNNKISVITNKEKEMEIEEPKEKMQRLMKENEELKKKVNESVENNNAIIKNKNNERLVEMNSTTDLRDIIEKRRQINFRQFNNAIEKFDGSKDFDQWWQDAIGYLKQFEDLGIQEKEKIESFKSFNSW